MVTTVLHLKKHQNEISLLNNQPIIFAEGQYIHCPTIAEIEDIGEVEFFSAYNLLTTDQYQVDEFCRIHSNLPKYIVNDFVYLAMQGDPESYNNILKVLECFFQKPIQINCIQQKIIIGIEDKIIVEKKNFFDFQNILRIIMGREENQDEDLSQITDKRILNFKQKMRENDLARRKKSSSDRSYTITLSDMICSIMIYTGIAIQQLFTYNYFTICKIYDRIRSKQGYEEKFKMITVGADIKDMSDWMMTKI